MTDTSPIDGVKLALLNNRLEGISRKMGNTLLRTGRSGVLNIARDFSCCILTRDNRLLTTTESLPIHVLVGPDMMAAAMQEFHPDLKRGDAFLHNSPYHGCSHPADHTILVPVIDDAGRHRFTMLAKAHQADIGNSIPTTYHGTARDVYEEGALIFPAVKVQEDFKNNEDFIRMCRMRIRVPDQWWGDYLAMMGAARIGEREMLALAAEVGWDTLEAFIEQWFDYSEKRMVAAIGQIPAGTATRQSTHDAIPGTPADGITVTSTVTIDPAGGRIAVDLTDNPDALPCGLNLSESCARTAAMVGVFNSIDHTVPKNWGSFRRIEVLLKENSVCGIPRHPTSCSAATTNVADRVANPTQAAIAEIADGLGLAECGAIIPPAVGVISGVDPDTGEPYVNQVFIAFSEGAAGPKADAWQTIAHVGNAGLCYIDSVELDELRQPIYIHSRSFVADTEGAGRHCGARSAYAEFGPVRGSMDVAYVADGNINGPQGVRGGLGGSTSAQFRVTRNGDHEDLPNTAVVTLQQGERIGSLSCGGGGYGPPTDRDPRAVAHDVAEGWVNADRAREVYRVAVAADGTLDRAATQALRAGR